MRKQNNEEGGVGGWIWGECKRREFLLFLDDDKLKILLMAFQLVITQIITITGSELTFIRDKKKLFLYGQL